MRPSGVPPIRVANTIHVPTTQRLRRLIDTPIFQRLASLAQLDLVYLVYPGARHSRFEHSLATYYYALRFIKRLLEEPYFAFHFTPEELAATLLAALIHDIGHYPMAHAIDDSEELRRFLPDHEDVGRNLLGSSGRVGEESDHSELSDRIREWGPDPKLVARIAFGGRFTDSFRDKRIKLLRSIISGPLDIDKIAYLQIDSIHTGNPVGTHFDAEQIIDSLALTPTKDSIALTEKGRAAAETLTYARYRMHINVYWHHVARVSRKMLARAIDYLLAGQRDATKQAVANQIVGFTDDELFQWLGNVCQARTPSRKLLDHLVSSRPVKSPISSRRARQSTTSTAFQLSRRNRRDLFKRVFVSTDGQLVDYVPVSTMNRLHQSGIGLMDYEERVARLLSKEFDPRIDAWEVILDDRSRREDVSTSIPIVSGNGESLVQEGTISESIRSDFGILARRAHLYVSPRVANLVEGRENDLASWLDEAART